MHRLKKAIKKNKHLYSFLTNSYRFIYEFIREQKRLYYLILHIKVFLNKKYSLNKYEFISVKEFCTKYNSKYVVIEKEKLREICKPYYYGSQNSEEIERYISPEIYTAELTNVKIIGGNSFIIYDDYCLYDMAVSDKDNRYDLRFESLKIIEKQHAILEYEEKDEVIEKAIFLSGFASFNYYHVTLELLSRLKYIDEFEEYRAYPLILDKIVLEVKQYKELLKKINMYNHPIIAIEAGSMYKVKKMLYPSYNTWMPINVKNRGALQEKDFLIAKSGVEYIRNSVLKEVNSESYRKIFISRKKLGNQRLTNEEKVRDIFVKYGFKIVYPEDLSFDEQVKAFSEAKYVAGSTGAAFTNIIYCQRDATIICLIPMNYKFYLWSTIAKMINLKSIYFDAKITKKGKSISEDQFEVDLDYCESFLKSI